MLHVLAMICVLYITLLLVSPHFAHITSSHSHLLGISLKVYNATVQQILCSIVFCFHMACLCRLWTETGRTYRASLVLVFPFFIPDMFCFWIHMLDYKLFTSLPKLYIVYSTSSHLFQDLCTLPCLRKRQHYYQLTLVACTQYKINTVFIGVYLNSDDYMPVMMIC